MNGWRLRIFRDADGILTFRETEHEDGVAVSWTEDAILPMGVPEVGDDEAMLELRWTVAAMNAALCFPVIDEEKQLEILARKATKPKAITAKLKLIEE